MEKHTPAPWHVDFFNNIWSSAKGRHSKVANLADRPQADGYDQIPEEEVAANAQLMAASPDLLDALKGMVLNACSACDENYVIRCTKAEWEAHVAATNRAIAIIARAEGKE